MDETLKEFTQLLPGIDYTFSDGCLVLNSASISTRLAGTPTTYFFLTTAKLHILYLSRITYNDESPEGIQIRGFRYKTRINSK